MSINRPSKQFSSWPWVLGAVIVIFNVVRNSLNQSIKEEVQEVLMKEYGDAIQDYRSDPIRFRARIQQQVVRGQATQEEADQFVEMVKTMSRKLP